MTEHEKMLFRLSNAIDDPDSGVEFFTAAFYWAIFQGIPTEKAADEIVGFRGRPGMIKIPKPYHIGGPR